MSRTNLSKNGFSEALQRIGLVNKTQSELVFFLILQLECQGRKRHEIQHCGLRASQQLPPGVRDGNYRYGRKRNGTGTGPSGYVVGGGRLEHGLVPTALPTFVVPRTC